MLRKVISKLRRKNGVILVKDNPEKGTIGFPKEFARQVTEVYREQSNRTDRCLTYETNQLEFCTKVIHVLHCEFCQIRLRSIYPDKFAKEEKLRIKQNERF